jgi:hypothetical protein
VVRVRAGAGRVRRAAAERGGQRRSERHTGGGEVSGAVGFARAWRLIGRATAGAASLPRRMAQKRARQNILGPQHFRAPAGGSHGLSRAANQRLICRARVLPRLLEMLVASIV